ncbi:GNAT family N-acetyltransferase [Vibrio europaeus]|uniref:GNAT family N-acetyltransferase n=1 Tax=Vibrio europaeus TaxID=300876 RepID=UPI00148DC9C5|nr:GNAT family N-acetyltransferase [Vibrio europaeus]MDC5722741.1 GNAT family N-acetyltransferase [Vibrio europaeus]MDC5758523.1 GNAT family N-acetyltransferase [Vibrio europaeus]MDC5777570.1 GNAT family N-acetyltransferase [Vibrio europaeus]MDC5796564.1 GNAT family N-acetyltransferase [Vibrio europaeus]MDC5801366.1 GNAT family N-acetyltransferase [Vibrio europaeus]
MIRKAVESDHSDLVRLFILENQHNAQLASDIVRETEDVLTLEELKQILADSSQYLVVKEVDGVAVGALLGSITNTPERRWNQARLYAYLEELIVCPASRGKGIARELVDSFVHWAQSHGASSVDLHVWSNNDSAMGFYRTYGFSAKQYLMTYAKEK